MMKLFYAATAVYVLAWSQGFTPTIQDGDPAKGGTVQAGFAHGYAETRCEGGSETHCDELAELRAENLRKAGQPDTPEVAQS